MTEKTRYTIRINGRDRITVFDPDEIPEATRQAWAELIERQNKRHEQKDARDWRVGNILIVAGLAVLMTPCALAQLPPVVIGPVFVPVVFVAWGLGAFLIWRGYRVKISVIERNGG